MQANLRTGWQPLAYALALTAIFTGVGSAYGASMNVMLSGAQEVPPVTTSATGSGTVTIGDDKSVSGSITTTGVMGTAAHIHEAPAGKNGPVIVPMTKGGDNMWTFAPGAKLTDAQMESLKAGNLYINVHSDANKGGEIRGQLKP